jgi:NAD(P)-dependent dehydrogenase (short-subunit alcohol dehydrogenase family)
MAKSQIDAPVWFVTGCSSGFGREFVRSALAHGFRVVATARDPKKLDDIIAGHKGNAIALPLDVTNAEEIKRAVSEAERVFGRIDVLINNAGYGYLAAVEKGEDKNIRAVGMHPSWSDGNFINGVVLDCADDAAAIESAQKYADGHDIEVWDRKRKVPRFPAC